MLLGFFCYFVTPNKLYVVVGKMRSMKSSWLEENYNNCKKKIPFERTIANPNKISLRIIKTGVNVFRAVEHDKFEIVFKS